MELQYRLLPLTARFASPDLSRLAIQQSNDVLICDVKTCGNQSNLPVTTLIGWTPDGTALLQQGPPGLANIWITRVGDGTMHQVTRFDDATASSIRWSADGHRVAVTRQQSLSDFDWFGLFPR